MIESAPSLVQRAVGGPLPRGKARRHSVFVRILRVLLPLVMLAIIGLLAALIAAHAVKREAASLRDANTPIRMVNPRFFGRDSQGRPYILAAREASRDERSFQIVLLGAPRVDLDVGGPRPSTLTADTGVYHEDSRILLLKGHVRGDKANQGRFATDEAVVNTLTGTVTGPTGLAGETSVGSIHSRGFDVYDKGDRVIFKGGVHARLNSH
ncbi:MAG: LPS export ABC transporter periplasmic protein LptC [Caulobacteraceae bacterium]